MSGDPEQEYFSDGISEDIITDLSNVSALSVVARNIAFTFKGQSLDVREVAKRTLRKYAAKVHNGWKTDTSLGRSSRRSSAVLV